MDNNDNQLSVNELIQKRLESISELKKLNIQAFAYEFDKKNEISEIKDHFESLEGKDVTVAGRIKTIRKMGKASFFNLQDKSGTIQIYIKKDDVGENEYTAFKLFDIGDIVGVEGFVFKTKTGEISVHCKSISLLAKTIKPIPVAKEVIDEDGKKTIFDAFSDKEMRYRQRYLDLIVNENVKDVFIKRSKIISSIREFLDKNGLLEVETPILQPLYGGASARPFITHHNTLNMQLYLRIADELYLKRLIVGGLEGVYEIGKDFRNEGIDKTHNPEFTMLELYVAYKDYNWMMSFVENLIANICDKVLGKRIIKIEGNIIDFNPPWKRISMVEEIQNATGINILNSETSEMIQYLEKLNIKLKGGESRGKIIDELFETSVQNKIIQPTFVIDYPIELSPLAKKHREKSGLVERFEGFVIGREICNAFSELNDPIDQRERFESQSKAFDAGDDEAHQIDEDYITALEYGMPPTAGLGIGIDRLVMLLTNQPTIRDVIFFPHMRNKV